MLLKRKMFSVAILFRVLVASGLFMLGSNMLIQGSLAEKATAKVKGISVMAAYARASIGNLKNSAAFFTVLNEGDKPDRIIGVKSDIAKTVELHTHIKKGDVMQMRKIDGMDVAAKGFVDFKPGSHHVMLIGLHKPLKADDKFSITLIFKEAGELKVDVTVKGLGAKSHAGSHPGSDADSHAGSHADAEKKMDKKGKRGSD